MAYTPTKDLEVVRRREHELALARTRGEVDALEAKWQAEDRAWAEAADWRSQQVRALTQRIAQLERILGPRGKRLTDDLVAGIGGALGNLRHRAPFRPAPAGSIYAPAMKQKSELKRLAEAVRQAEAELDAATTRSALNAAAKRLMNARAALKRMQPAGATRRAPSREAPGAGAS